MKFLNNKFLIVTRYSYLNSDPLTLTDANIWTIFPT